MDQLVAIRECSCKVFKQRPSSEGMRRVRKREGRGSSRGLASPRLSLVLQQGTAQQAQIIYLPSAASRASTSGSSLIRMTVRRGC